MRSDRLLLQDVLDAIEVVRRYLPAGRAAFDADEPLQSHILRNVMIVGEACWRLSQPLKANTLRSPGGRSPGCATSSSTITFAWIGQSSSRPPATTSRP